MESKPDSGHGARLPDVWSLDLQSGDLRSIPRLDDLGSRSEGPKWGPEVGSRTRAWTWESWSTELGPGVLYLEPIECGPGALSPDLEP